MVAKNPGPVQSSPVQSSPESRFYSNPLYQLSELLQEVTWRLLLVVHLELDGLSSYYLWCFVDVQLTLSFVWWLFEAMDIECQATAVSIW